ncbi:hypothetical protein EB796_007180 [Bugula neritina]|uniref:PWI domain-containing protein n=1 Tax=Bugula neritina TaxID=10212 RepID=A0A7J7K8G1_BUGNE|nr:hypothetical protein EB796_007180 [Bugula neritina]
MIVEDADCLKDWVIAELSKESIDADPDAVAKYTVALVRKGPDTEEEFKPSICENLSVFLTENTESFVMRLFSVLQDKSYITQTDTTGDLNSHLVNTTSENQENTDSALSRQESAVSRQDSKAHDTDDELSDDDRDHRRTNKRSRSKSQSPSGHSQNRHRISPHRRLGYSRGSYRGGGGGYAPRSNKRGARSRLGRGNYHNDFGRRYDNGNAPPPRRRSRSPRRSASPAPRRRSRSPRRSLSPRKSPSRRSRSPLDLLSSLNPVKPSTNKTTETRQRCQDYDESVLSSNKSLIWLLVGSLLLDNECKGTV